MLFGGASPPVRNRSRQRQLSVFPVGVARWRNGSRLSSAAERRREAQPPVWARTIRSRLKGLTRFCFGRSPRVTAHVATAHVAQQRVHVAPRDGLPVRVWQISYHVFRAGTSADVRLPRSPSLVCSVLLLSCIAARSHALTHTHAHGRSRSQMRPQGGMMAATRILRHRRFGPHRRASACVCVHLCAVAMLSAWPKRRRSA